MEYEIKSTNKISLGLKELWEFRELFYFFTWRDIKVKYKQTSLGILWAILQPFILMIVFTLFFGQALNVQTGNNTPYPIFVYSGLLLWNIFSSGLTNASNSMISNASIIKKIYFPRLIIPISSILVAIFDFLMALIIYFGMLIYYHQSVDFKIAIYLPLSILITIFTTFGLGTMLSALNLKFRDFKYVIPFFIQILFFISPVIYPVSIIKFFWIHKILMLNPMAGAIELLRSPIAHTSVNIELVVSSIVISLILFCAGLFYFRKTEYYFADIV